MDMHMEDNPDGVGSTREGWRTGRLAAVWRRQSRRGALFCLLGGFLLLGLMGGLAFYVTATAGLPDVTKLDTYDPAAGTKLYAGDGTLIANVIEEDRSYTDYNAIAPVMVQAIVAIEDKRFFEHGGVDLKGVVRAVVGNLGSGSIEQGASTLTMQLARRLFLTDERTYKRKVREAVLAYRMDRALSKEKILELYLNEVYYGAGAYGIGSAAGLYFGKKPAQLEVWQAAMLAGVVQAPSLLSPLEDRPAALKRMNEVLSAMVKAGSIAEKEMMRARNDASFYQFSERKVAQRKGMLEHAYFTTFVMSELARLFPERNLRRGGLQVVTSMDKGMQVQAERSTQEALGNGAYGADSGAVIALDNKTGEIVAMVGGLGWSLEDQFNRALLAKRQPGSTFKPFVYAAALEAGYSPEQEFADTEATFGPASNPWTPQNSDSRWMGAIPVRTGLQFSRNMVAAKVIAHVGPDKVIALAHTMGIDSDLPEYASLALGAGVATPLQMARAYSAFPSGGVIRPARVIRKVTTADGVVILDLTGEADEERVLSERTATVMCEMMHRVVTGGTGTAANLPGTFVGGKTGTTDNFVDAWFVGFTPHHTLAVWMGRDDNGPMDGMFGGSLPAEVFARVAKEGLVGRSAEAAFPGVSFDPSRTVTLCADSTYLALSGCPQSYDEVFQAGVIPERDCPIHRMAGDHDPRYDAEVVGPEGAKIAYSEKEPLMTPGTLPRRVDPSDLPSPEGSPSPLVPATDGPPLTDLPRFDRSVDRDVSEMSEAPADPSYPIAEPPREGRPLPPPTAMPEPAMESQVGPAEPTEIEPPPEAPPVYEPAPPVYKPAPPATDQVSAPDESQRQ